MAYHSSDQAAPARSWLAVVPSNSVNLPAGCRGIFVNATGDVALVGDDGVALTFTAIPAGTFMPCGPIRVNATGTTATVFALY